MKRAGLLIVALFILLCGPIAERVEAHGWRHFGGGGAYRHWGGYRGYGWGHHHHHWHGYRGVGYGSGWGYRPYYGYGWGYRPYYSFYRPVIGIGVGFGGYYGGYNTFYANPYYYYSTPLYYGQSYDFYNPWPVTYGYPSCSYSSPVINVTKIVVRKADVAPAAPVAIEPKGTVVRSSTIDTRSRARALVRLGDAAFREGRYVDALTRYRTAAETAPDDAEAQFRKGHAYIANGKFDQAAIAFRNALALEPAARRGGFRLDDLYGAKSAAKGVHLENLAAAALMHEDSADSYFLLGLMLRFEGEHDRAEKFFAKAASLSPETRRSLARLLPAAAEEHVSLDLGRDA